jgi:TonB family protein
MIPSFPRTLLLAAVAALTALPVVAQLPASGVLPATQPVSMVRQTSPVYPLDLLLKGRSGWAEVRFSVDYSGRPVLTSIASKSELAFGYALLADIESNEFMPPRVNGQPTLTLSGVRHTFDGEASLDASEKRILAELKKIKPAFLGPKELDAPLKSIRQAPPVYPYAALSDGMSGKAEIEYVIDRDGRCLLPKIISATSEDFGWSAATAVARWRFQPPVKGGQKVDVRTSVVISFDIAKGAATW